MLNKNPALIFKRGEWIAEIFENYKPLEPHICIYKPGKIVPEPAPWITVRKIFLQLRAEGFLDKYKGQKLWIGYPQKNEETGETKLHFVTTTEDPDCDDSDGHIA